MTSTSRQLPSRFPDEKAFKDWLYRLKLVSDDYDELRSGMSSGPAAPVYRQQGQAPTTSSAAVSSKPPSRPKTC